MAKLPVNEITLEGRIIRADYRKGVSKAGKPFLSANFTLDVEKIQPLLSLLGITFPQRM